MVLLVNCKLKLLLLEGLFGFSNTRNALCVLFEGDFKLLGFDGCFSLELNVSF